MEFPFYAAGTPCSKHRGIAVVPRSGESQSQWLFGDAMSEPAQKDTRHYNRNSRPAIFNPQQTIISTSYFETHWRKLSYRTVGGKGFIIACWRIKVILRKQRPLKNLLQAGRIPCTRSNCLPIAKNTIGKKKN